LVRDEKINNKQYNIAIMGKDEYLQQIIYESFDYSIISMFAATFLFRNYNN